MKDLYAKNDKTLTEEIEDTNKQKNILCTWIRRINIIKMSLLPKSHLQSQCNFYQNSNGIFHRNRRRILKFCMEPQKPVIAKAIRRKNKARDIPLPNSKLYYKDGFPVAQMVKNLPPMEETQFDSWVWKIPWRREYSSILA